MKKKQGWEKRIAELAAKMTQTLYEAGMPYRKALQIVRGWMEELKAIIRAMGKGR